MSKATATRLFIRGLIAVAAGAILAIAAMWVAIVNDVFVMNGPDIVGLRGSALAWSLLGLGVVGCIAIAGGMAAGLVSWIGVLLNTWRLENRTWFAVLLLAGIFNFGFVAMIGYLLAGPDSATAVNRAPAPAAAR